MSDAMQGVDMPTEVGWWVYKDGETCFAAEFVLFHPLGEWTPNFLRWRGELDDQSMRGHEFKIKYPGKWHKLTMPWDAPTDDLAKWQGYLDTIATGEIREIIEGKDEIENPLPVFTYDDQYRIIESVTDKYGWPNTDIQGRLMYENTWFATEGEAIAKAIDNCESSINWRNRLLETKRAEIAKLEEEIKSAQAAMLRLTIMSKEVQP